MSAFANRVAELERVMRTNLPTINNDIIQDLLTCIYEQQQALVLARDMVSDTMLKNAVVNHPNIPVQTLGERLNATIEKWKLP